MSQKLRRSAKGFFLHLTSKFPKLFDLVAKTDCIFAHADSGTQDLHAKLSQIRAIDHIRAARGRDNFKVGQDRDPEFLLPPSYALTALRFRSAGTLTTNNNLSLSQVHHHRAFLFLVQTLSQRSLHLTAVSDTTSSAPLRCLVCHLPARRDDYVGTWSNHQ